MVEWPEELIRDIARRRSVIVIGSGVSAQATSKSGSIPPTWKRFLSESNESATDGPFEHITKAINEGDLLHACEWLKEKYDHRWRDKLRSIFLGPEFQPTEVHSEIARLDSRIYFSLNFDDIFERSLQEVYGGTCVLKNYYDEDVIEFLRGTERYAVKVHGSLHHPERIIFTQKQYSEARSKESAFYTAFDGALMSHTFLFLGTGYTDPDINLVLENQNFSFNHTHPHYFLATGGMHRDLKRSLRKNRNLEVVEYDPIDEGYSGFREAITRLRDLVEQKRQEIGENLNW